MKYILTIILIIILMIGIYTYAHMNRYQIFAHPQTLMIIKYDNWTNRTFIFRYTDNVWVETSKRQRKLKK